MELYLACVAMVWGAVWGSFLNVVAYRLPRGESVVRPGSRCPSCGTPIKPWHNLPVLSWILLRGKCAYCGAPFSVRYAVVEALTALLSAALLLRLLGMLPPGADPLEVALPFLFHFYLLFTLLVTILMDAEFFLVPGGLITPGIAVGIAGALFAGPLTGVGVREALWGAALGGGLLLAVALAFLFLRRKEGLGEGDVLLVAMIGAFLGPTPLLFVFLASSLQGLAFAGLFWKRVKAQEMRVPFGPFLSLAALEWLFFSDVILAGFERWLGVS
jgi:leader peptidase (prepilin peptidase)/N-methyltransferase